MVVIGIYYCSRYDLLRDELPVNGLGRIRISSLTLARLVDVEI